MSSDVINSQFNPYFGRRYEFLNQFHDAYSFVFYKDLINTNMQYRELLALLIKYIEPKPWAFFDYKSYQKLINDLEDVKFLDKSIVIIPCHNSCHILLNGHIDLLQIINHSGYIQSCGPLIFVEPWYDIKEDDFKNALISYLQYRSPNCARIVFYSAEDFGLNSIKGNIILEPKQLQILWLI